MIKIDCVSDLHGNYPKLDGGDLLIVAGDLTARNDDRGYTEFSEWFKKQKYSKKILIGGNHDNQLQNGTFPLWIDGYSEYFCDSGTKFVYYPPIKKDTPDGSVIERRDFKIWGSPWTIAFEGMNPKCKAFTVDTEEQLAEKWALIPDDTDILITHSPPYGILDGLVRDDDVWESGSFSLRKKVLSMNSLKLHVFGHIHEHGGVAHKLYKSSYSSVINDCIYVNASHVNERYEPVNKPIRIEL